MERFAEKALKNWFHSDVRKPLVIRGARQVGKSTLVRQFCQAEKLELIEINLEQKKLKQLAKSSDINPAEIIEEIELATQSDLNQTQQILFIDEIQAQPEMYVALRYFYEQYSHIAIVAAGSLLEVILNEGAYSVPVGRIEYLHLGPMTFSEFLLALDEKKLLKTLETKESLTKITDASHQYLLKRLREFFLVGGMPEVVKDFVKNQSFKNTRRLQESIIETYVDDFKKYGAKTQLDKLQTVFFYTPRHLGEKVKYTEIDREVKSRDLKKCIDLLTAARVLTPVFHSEASGVPLEGQADSSLFKLFFLDIGLATAILQIAPADVLRENLISIFEGKLAEQFIAQHLYNRSDFTRPRLHYWLRDQGQQKAEIDFVIERKGQVIPCEVKAGTGGKLKSLAVFFASKKMDCAFKFAQNKWSRKKQVTKIRFGSITKEISFQLEEIPLYGVECSTRRDGQS